MPDLIAQTLSNPAIGVLGTAVVLAGVALWLAGAWWAYADASRRAESSLAGFVAAGWIILSTPLLLPLSLAVYAFARPQVTAADRRTRALAYELAMGPERPTCATCASVVDDAWLRCPTCSSWLATPCSDCGGWSDASLELCPWCGGEERDAPYVEAPSEVASGLARRNRRRLASRTPSSAVLRSQLRDAREGRDGRDGRRSGLTQGAATSSLRRA
jgi:RNA polymerase subunit RPABC4/transcription elongation factor Spt4